MSQSGKPRRTRAEFGRKAGWSVVDGARVWVRTSNLLNIRYTAKASSTAASKHVRTARDVPDGRRDILDHDGRSLARLARASVFCT